MDNDRGINMSEETNIEDMNIYQRIHAIESHIDFMRQDSEGYKYSYLSLSAILHMVKPLLRKYRVVLNMQNVKSETETVGKELLFKNDYLFTWVNIDDPKDSYSVPWHQTGKNGFEQGAGSAATYCKRYFLLEQFHIPNEKEDPDYIRNAKLEKNKTPDLSVHEKEDPTREQWFKGVLNACVEQKDLDKIAKKIGDTSWPKALISGMMAEIKSKSVAFECDIIMNEIEGFLGESPNDKAITGFRQVMIGRTNDEKTLSKIIARFDSHKS